MCDLQLRNITGVNSVINKTDPLWKHRRSKSIFNEHSLVKSKPNSVQNKKISMRTWITKAFWLCFAFQKKKKGVFFLPLNHMMNIILGVILWSRKKLSKKDNGKMFTARPSSTRTYRKNKHYAKWCLWSCLWGTANGVTSRLCPVTAFIFSYLQKR